MPTSYVSSFVANKATEAVQPPSYYSNPQGVLLSQSINITSGMQADANTSSTGLGDLFIVKTSNTDQQNNIYAPWTYTAVFNQNGPLGAGSITFIVPLTNQTYWPIPTAGQSTYNQPLQNQNPSEILTSGGGATTYPGQILYGTGPYLNISGTVEKVKDSSNYRTYDLFFSLP